MARSNVAYPTNNGARKKMVQPVLPALPLLSKPKIEPVREQKEEKIVANGAELPDRDGSHADYLASSSTNKLEGKDQEQETEQLQLESSVDHSVAVEAVDIQPEPADSAIPNSPNLAQSQEDNQDQRNGQHVQEPTKIDSHTEELIEVEQTLPDIQPVKLDQHLFDMTTASNENSLITTPIDLSNSRKVEQTDFDAGTAPEPVTGNVETNIATLHSANFPASNTNASKSPQHVFEIPPSPASVVDASNNPPPSGDSLASPAPVRNGHNSSTSTLGIPNSAGISNTGQPTFPTIFSHIHALQFMNEWFDCEVCVYHPQSTKPAIYRNAHSLILIRSERLRNFIYPQRANSYPYYVINLVPARIIDSHAFDAALRFLYNDTILSADRLIPQNVVLDKAGKMAAFNYAISYMFAGLELGLEPVTTRALDLIGRLLDWDTAEMAVKEASLLRAASSTTINPHAPPDAIFAAKSILQHVFNLIVLRLNPKEFNLDIASSPVDLISRFAQFEAGKAAVNPALANMVFGSMPVSATTPATSPTASPPLEQPSPDTIASNIMLNVEFEDFRELAKGLRKVHGEDGLQTVLRVMEEREHRRSDIFNNRSLTNAQRLANPTTWDVVGWREYVLDGALRRERVGFLQPSKRGGKY